MIELTTENLTIRPLTEADAADLTEYRSDPDVCRFQGYEPFDIEKSRDFIADMKQRHFGVAGDWFQLGIILNREDKLIGDVGLKPDADDAETVEFGISLARLYQGRGFAREALTAIFDHLALRYRAKRIIGITDADNVRCILLLDSLGFTREAVLKDSYLERGKWRDEILYVLSSIGQGV